MCGDLVNGRPGTRRHSEGSVVMIQAASPRILGGEGFDLRSRVFGAITMRPGESGGTLAS